MKNSSNSRKKSNEPQNKAAEGSPGRGNPGRGDAALGFSGNCWENSLKERKLLFKGARFDVGEVEIENNKGKRVSRQMIFHPGAVVILPLIDAEKVVFIRNERYAVGKTLWELPAGTLEPDEAPDDTARRELIEETGYSAAQMTPLTRFYTTPGFCNEIMYAYAATGLAHVGQRLEDSEKIEVKILPWNEILPMIKKGEICDGKTISTLLYYKEFILKLI